MSSAAIWVPIVIEMAAGGLSAGFVGNVVPPLSFGAWKNALIGAVGGVVVTWLTARTPVLEEFVEEYAADGTHILTAEVLVGVGVAGLLGGALFLTVAGLLRNYFRS